MSKHMSFTIEFDPKKRPMLQVEVRNNDKRQSVVALWDTGASSCCISKRLVTDLGLIKTGDGTLTSVVAGSSSSIYNFKLVLPNHIVIDVYNAFEMIVDDKEYDIIIGNDVMILGDFSICYYDGHVTLSFRVPSKGCIDFTKQSE